MEAICVAWIRNPQEFICPLFFEPKRNKFIRPVPRPSDRPFDIYDLIVKEGDGNIPILPGAKVYLKEGSDLDDGQGFLEDIQVSRPFLEKVLAPGKQERAKDAFKDLIKTDIKTAFGGEMVLNKAVQMGELPISVGIFRPSKITSIDVSMAYRAEPSERKGLRMRMAIEDLRGNNFFLPVPFYLTLYFQLLHYILYNLYMI